MHDFVTIPLYLLEIDTKIWFISDTHFDHTNIIKYCNRPFNTVEDMNNIMLKNWNYYISNTDTVFFVGDMAFGRGSRKPSWWLKQLNGNIYYLKGSHDEGITPFSEGLNNVKFVTDAIILTTEYGRFYITHNPVNIPVDWSGWAIHGHTHNNDSFFCTDFNNKRFNVSVEVMDYKPRNLQYFLTEMNKRR